MLAMITFNTNHNDNTDVNQSDTKCAYLSQIAQLRCPNEDRTVGPELLAGDVGPKSF